MGVNKFTAKKGEKMKDFIVIEKGKKGKREIGQL